LLQKYRKINDTHRSYLRRKELYKLKEGACIYLINMIGLNDDPQTVSKIKIGYTGDITNRVSVLPILFANFYIWHIRTKIY
jgi:hypothetical protein